MTFVSKDKNPPLCIKCGNYRQGGCTLYVDVITGLDVNAREARKECEGNRWTARALDEILDGAHVTIETDMATIHRDPFAKINKNYE